jgi:aspartate/glutamate racemase
MEDDFYRHPFETKHSLRVDIPNSTDQQFVHGAIYEELCQGSAKRLEGSFAK